jgi:uncharacterized small protein (DUF1192 family)
MLQRLFARKGRWWAGFGSLLGTVALLCVPAARSQETRSETQPPQGTTTETKTQRVSPPRETAKEKREARRAAREARHPYHTYSLNKEREEVEILEAQLAAKRAHLRLAEARLKQAQDQLAFLKQKGGNDPETQERLAMLQSELPVLEAERDAEQAEMREPQVLLRHARRWLEFFENLDTRGAEGLGGQVGMGFMGMEHLGGMPPTGLGQGQGAGQAGDVDDELNQLRTAVENLGRQIESLRSGPAR